MALTPRGTVRGLEQVQRRVPKLEKGLEHGEAPFKLVGINASWTCTAGRESNRGRNQTSRRMGLGA